MIRRALGDARAGAAFLLGVAVGTIIGLPCAVCAMFAMAAS